MNARKRRPVIASAFIRLRLLVGCDPAPDLRLSAPVPPADLDHGMLGMGFKIRRGANRHNVRRAAKATGISSAAVSRLENGHPMSIETVLSACRYIGAHPFGYVKPKSFTSNMRCNTLKQQATNHVALS